MSGRISRRDLFWLLGGGAAVATWPVAAQAWIPGAPYLIQRLFERRKNMKALTATGVLTVYDNDLPGGRRQVNQTLHLRAPDDLRLEVSGPEGDFIEVADGKKRATMKAGKVQPVTADHADLWRALMIGGATDIKRMAQASGVDLNKVRLGRLLDDEGQPRGAVCYIVGAAVGETDTAQIWIDKETSQPRLLKEKGPPDKARSILFDEWDDENARGWFPALTTRRTGDHVSEVLRTSKLTTNPKLDAKLFDVALLGKTPPGDKPKKP